MTWRSIESDPPKMGQKVWLATSERRYEWAIEWSLPWLKSTWTHWSPCEPPADLPPKPRAAFEEWWESLPESRISHREKITPSGVGLNFGVAKWIFEAGREAGKAKG